MTMGGPTKAAPDVERVQPVEMDVLPGDGTVAMEEFVRARRETIRYHETLYMSTSLGTQGSWLAHPHPLVMDSLRLVTHPVHAYDLGAGVGRHTLPIVAGLQASWLKTAEAIDFVQAVAPQVAIGIHDAQVNERGLASINGWLDEKRGTDYRWLPCGTSIPAPD